MYCRNAVVSQPACEGGKERTEDESLVTAVRGRREYMITRQPNRLVVRRGMVDATHSTQSCF
jgi:hypothetical protein